jgi:hypothetical protein
MKFDLRNDLKLGEYVIFATDSEQKGHLCRYWMQAEDAKNDMKKLWERNKGLTFYLVKLESIVMSSDKPLLYELPKPIERVNLTLEKSNNTWSVK